ncbi:MAG: hypothetical protein R3B90_06725 [Planctomycetaceae bacterium]
MKKSSTAVNAALMCVYALVAIGLFFALRGNSESASPAVTDRLAAEADDEPESPLPAHSHVLAGKPSRTASTGEAAGDAPRIIPESALAQAPTRPLAQADASARRDDLFIPESPPSTNPNVAERQRRVGLGVGASLGGLRPFPADNAWNQEITNAPVDPMSDAILSTIGFDRGLHPDIGSGEWEGCKIGIPYVVVSAAQPMVPVEFTEYGDESDPGPYPLPIGTPIEGAPRDDADRHAIVIDRDNWKLYELSYAYETGAGWTGHCGAVFDLSKHPSRPAGWTSADAAGLPIFPGLVRYDEVAAGEIRHALRFTLSRTRRAYVPPASHWASRERNALLPPMGMRVRLKADVDITGYPRDVQVILRALQKYGMILADNGSDWFISGAPDERWDNDALHVLKKIKGSDFEVLRMDGLVAE